MRAAIPAFIGNLSITKFKAVLHPGFGFLRRRDQARDARHHDLNGAGKARTKARAKIAAHGGVAEKPE
jgi:hypothetical protein